MWEGMTRLTQPSLKLQTKQLHLAVPVENRVAVVTAEWSAVYHWQSNGCLGDRGDQCTYRPATPSQGSSVSQDLQGQQHEQSGGLPRLVSLQSKHHLLLLRAGACWPVSNSDEPSAAVTGTAAIWWTGTPLAMQGLTGDDGRLRMLAAAASELAAATGAAGVAADGESVELRAGRWSCSQGHPAGGEVGGKVIVRLHNKLAGFQQDMPIA